MCVIKPRFADRTEELKFLLELTREGSPVVEYIYSPEGCSKTRLLREFAQRFSGVTVYIDALEEERVSKVVFSVSL
ncbi:MAG: hypothetical protein DRJ52_09095 [Thermoprotei archaeon]|nr:MAG: hypothetical protein DRJ52_09095 [Thermoprotei archaeon]